MVGVAASVGGVASVGADVASAIAAKEARCVAYNAESTTWRV
jgi:hypothetical protein